MVMLYKYSKYHGSCVQSELACCPLSVWLAMICALLVIVFLALCTCVMHLCDALV